MNRGWIIKLLIQLGCDIEYRKKVRKNGYTVYYITRIRDKKFRCEDQADASRELEKVLKEYIGDDDDENSEN